MYITPLWSGIVSFFFKGKSSFDGMPAFNKPFSKILNSKEFQVVDIVLFVNVNKVSKYELQLPKEYEYLNVKQFRFNSGFQLFIRFFQAFFYILRSSRKKKVDVLYAHGGIGAVAGLANLFLKKHFIQRIYGSFLINEIGQPNFKLFLKHPIEFLAFRLPASHVIITNDGTHGDRVFEKIGSASKLHFLINGVNKTPDIIAPKISVPKEDFITYIARVDRWKQQDKLIEALKIYRDKKGKEIPAFIIGHFANPEYLEELKSLIANYQLEKVELTGPLPMAEAAWLMKHSLATLSLYHTSNLGNVFLEALSIGTPAIAVNCNDSLATIPEDCYCSLSDYDAEAICNKIIALLNDEEKKVMISKNSKAYAESKLLSWDERVKLEIDMLKSA